MVQQGHRVVFSGCAGRNNKPHDYNLLGSHPTKAFDAMGAFGSMAFAYNTVILPEIQVGTHTDLHTNTHGVCIQPSHPSVYILMHSWRLHTSPLSYLRSGGYLPGLG